MTVTSPNTAVSWRIGTAQSLRWNQNLGVGSLVRVELSRDGGGTWETLAASFANTGATSSLLPWTVNGPATTTALLRVTWLGGPSTSDVSNAAFAVTRPTITVTAPNTAVTWSVGSTRAITWSHNLPTGELVDLDVSRDGGTNWSPIANGVANTSSSAGSFSWTVSGPESATTRIRVRWSADPLTNDTSNVDFTVIAPVVTLTAPNTAVTWRVGSTQTLRATHNLGVGQPMAFDLSADDGTTWTELTQVTTGYVKRRHLSLAGRVADVEHRKDSGAVGGVTSRHRRQRRGLQDHPANHRHSAEHCGDVGRWVDANDHLDAQPRNERARRHLVQR